MRRRWLAPEYLKFLNLGLHPKVLHCDWHRYYNRQLSIARHSVFHVAREGFDLRVGTIPAVETFFRPTDAESKDRNILQPCTLARNCRRINKVSHPDSSFARKRIRRRNRTLSPRSAAHISIRACPAK